MGKFATDNKLFRVVKTKQSVKISKSISQNWVTKYKMMNSAEKKHDVKYMLMECELEMTYEERCLRL